MHDFLNDSSDEEEDSEERLKTEEAEMLLIPKA